MKKRLLDKVIDFVYAKSVVILIILVILMIVGAFGIRSIVFGDSNQILAEVPRETVDTVESLGDSLEITIESNYDDSVMRFLKFAESSIKYLELGLIMIGAFVTVFTVINAIVNIVSGKEVRDIINDSKKQLKYSQKRLDRTLLEGRVTKEMSKMMVILSDLQVKFSSAVSNYYEGKYNNLTSNINKIDALQLVYKEQYIKYKESIEPLKKEKYDLNESNTILERVEIQEDTSNYLNDSLNYIEKQYKRIEFKSENLKNIVRMVQHDIDLDLLDSYNKMHIKYFDRDLLGLSYYESDKIDAAFIKASIKKYHDGNDYEYLDILKNFLYLIYKLTQNNQIEDYKDFETNKPIVHKEIVEKLYKEIKDFKKKEFNNQVKNIFTGVQQNYFSYKREWIRGKLSDGGMSPQVRKEVKLVLSDLLKIIKEEANNYNFFNFSLQILNMCSTKELISIIMEESIMKRVDDLLIHEDITNMPKIDIVNLLFDYIIEYLEHECSIPSSVRHFIYYNIGNSYYLRNNFWKANEYYRKAENIIEEKNLPFDIKDKLYKKKINIFLLEKNQVQYNAYYLFLKDKKRLSGIGENIINQISSAIQTDNSIEKEMKKIEKLIEPLQKSSLITNDLWWRYITCYYLIKKNYDDNHYIIASEASRKMLELPETYGFVQMPQMFFYIGFAYETLFHIKNKVKFSLPNKIQEAYKSLLDNAIKNYNEAYELSSFRSDIRRKAIILESYQEKINFNNIKDALDNLIQLNEESDFKNDSLIRAYEKRGDLFANKGYYDRSIDDYYKGLEITSLEKNPVYYSDIQLKLGQVFLKKNDLKKAFDFFVKADNTTKNVRVKIYMLDVMFRLKSLEVTEENLQINESNLSEETRMILWDIIIRHATHHNLLQAPNLFKNVLGENFPKQYQALKIETIIDFIISYQDKCLEKVENREPAALQAYLYYTLAHFKLLEFKIRMEDTIDKYVSFSKFVVNSSDETLLENLEASRGYFQLALKVKRSHFEEKRVNRIKVTKVILTSLTNHFNIQKKPTQFKNILTYFGKNVFEDEESIQEHLNALENEMFYYEDRADMAIIYYHLGNYQSALMHCSDVLRSNPRNLEMLLTRSAIYLYQKNYEYSRIDLKIASEVNPNHYKVFYRLCQYNYVYLNTIHSKADNAIYINNYIKAFYKYFENLPIYEIDSCFLELKKNIEENFPRETFHTFKTEDTIMQWQGLIKTCGNSLERFNI